MLQRLLSLFLPHRHPDKMGPLIENLTPSKYIPGLMASARLSTTPTGWLKLMSNVGLDETDLVHMDQCVVGELAHLRGSDKGKKGHEKVAFTFHLATDDTGAQVGPHNSRAASVHRRSVGKPADSSRTQPKAQAGVGRLYGVGLLQRRRRHHRRQLRRTQPERQSFTVPTDTPVHRRLTALDCAVLASVVSQWAQNYSNLQYTCYWFSALFFLAARRICEWLGYPPTDGAKRLQYGGSIDKTKRAMRKGMIASGVSMEEVEDLVENAIDSTLERIT
ncbi:hypothetical protein B0H13DRAFT_1911622 [Mycena leptocephala]|nr:hypothetical protein B0H13DRAFT_1911622 [Mycena leptocephala]